jgi:hypothetical protein
MFDVNGRPMKSVRSYSETYMEMVNNPCAVQTKTQTSIGSKTSVSDFATTMSWIWVATSVPEWGTYTGRGKHWYRITPVGATTDFGETSQTVEMQQGEECELEDDGNSDTEECGENGSPIVIDMNNDGFQLVGQDDAVPFDLTGDGTTEMTNWTARDSDDAFLALDRNRNGSIDSGSELFGNFTPVYFRRPLPTGANGFVVLKFFEDPANGATRADGVITARDPGFRQLLLWRDSNHNGLSEPWELTAAMDAGLASIDAFNYRESRRRDRFGNEFRQVSDSTWDADRVRLKRRLVDVWFKYAR